MIKVLQVGLSSNPGGIESCILNYHRFIDRALFQFDYVDIYGRGIAYSNEILALGGRIHTLPNYKRRPIGMACGLQRRIKAGAYDIVHINLLSAANIIPVAVACRNMGVSVIVHSHNASLPSGRLRRWMNSQNLGLIRRMPVEKWGCGEAAGRWMWGEGFCPDNIIPNAIDRKKFSPDLEKREKIRHLCNFGQGDQVLGFAGRFCEQKNVLFLPEILRALKERDGRYKLLLVGDGALKGELQGKFELLGLSGSVFFAGLQANMGDWYQAMDAFLLPSLFEGLPVVGVEAQAVGLPCFVSDRVTAEINLTGAVKFLPIEEGGSVWADAIVGALGQEGRAVAPFPEEYTVQAAVARLEGKYSSLQRRGEKGWKPLK